MGCDGCDAGHDTSRDVGRDVGRDGRRNMGRNKRCCGRRGEGWSRTGGRAAGRDRCRGKMKQVYAMCPCCGRSILVDHPTSPALSNKTLAANAKDHGGDVWVYEMKGRQIGGKIKHESTSIRSPKVVAELARRCQAFLERLT